MKKTELRKPNSSNFGGIPAAKSGFSAIAKRTASATSPVIATSGAMIATPGPRDNRQRITTIARRITATPSFHDAMIMVACIPVLRTPKKKAIVTAWNGKTHSSRTIGSASSAPVLGVESARARALEGIANLAVHPSQRARQITRRARIALAPISVNSGGAGHHEPKQQARERNCDRQDGIVGPHRFSWCDPRVDHRNARCVVDFVEQRALILALQSEIQLGGAVHLALQVLLLEYEPRGGAPRAILLVEPPKSVLRGVHVRSRFGDAGLEKDSLRSHFGNPLLGIESTHELDSAIGDRRAELRPASADVEKHHVRHDIERPIHRLRHLLDAFFHSSLRIGGARAEDVDQSRAI